MADLLEYALRVLPGLVLLTVVWIALRGPAIALRITILLLGFILVRDVMTPLGLWSFGTIGPAVWLRFTDDPAVLLGLAAASVLLVGAIYRGAHPLRHLVVWGRADSRSVLTGMAGAAVVVVPFVVAGRFVPLDERGGAVALSLLPAVFALAMAGNLLEEVLFRGYLQGHLATSHSPARTVVLSGLFFATGHILLASTVTAVGVPLLLFTLFEGLVCAEVARRRGVIAATLTHGLAIFFLASGLI